MKIAILGATGRTGRHLVAHAVERGHQVVALARDPAEVASPTGRAVEIVAADVTRPSTILAAVADADVVLSGLGVAKGQDPRILSDGAAVVASSGRRVVWLGAVGTGSTAGALGPVNDLLLRRVLHDWQAKRDADEAVLGAGGTVVAAGILTDRPYAGNGRLVEAPGFRRWVPPRSPRAGIAALMVAEAERDEFRGRTAIPLFGLTSS